VNSPPPKPEVILTNFFAEPTVLLVPITSRVRVITKLPNSEQSSKGKVKTHMYINRENQSTTGKLGKQ
jgi:hypothetical protein